MAITAATAPATRTPLGLLPTLPLKACNVSIMVVLFKLPAGCLPHQSRNLLNRVLTSLSFAATGVSLGNGLVGGRYAGVGRGLSTGLVAGAVAASATGVAARVVLGLYTAFINIGGCATFSVGVMLAGTSVAGRLAKEAGCDSGCGDG